MMTADYKQGNEQKTIKMQGNATHQNLLLVYHPQCKHCQAVRSDWIQLAQTIVDKKVPVNVLAINDGQTSYKKLLPGNLKIDYYPLVLLLKNDQEQTAVEFGGQDDQPNNRN